MARLPSELYVIQQNDGIVTLSEDGSQREIARFDPADANATARAQKTIYDSELSDEDKCFAHFWSGYFHAHAGGEQPSAEPSISESLMAGAIIHALTSGTWEQEQTRLHVRVPMKACPGFEVSSDSFPGQRFRVEVREVMS